MITLHSFEEKLDQVSKHPLVPFMAFGFAIGLLTWLFWGVAITCGDDFFASTNPSRHGGFWNGVQNLARGQSRFYQYFTVPVWQWATADESVGKLFTLRIITALLNLAAFTFFLSHLLGSRRMGILISASFLGAVVIDYSFSGFHALPLWFGMPTAFLFLSLGAFLHFLKTKKQTAYFIAVISFAITLLYYESFLLNLPVYGLLMMARRDTSQKNKFPAFLFSAFTNRLLWPFYGIALVYTLAYLLFQMFFPQGYAGFQISVSSIGVIITTAWKFSLSGINLGFSGRWSDLLNISSSIPVILFSLGATLFTILAVAQGERQRLTNLNAWHLGAIAVLLFSPNLLHAITVRYQEWARIDARYLGSFYSAFPLWLLIVLIMRSSFSLLKNRHMRTAAWLLLFSGLFLGFSHNLKLKEGYFGKMREQTEKHHQNQKALGIVLGEYAGIKRITSPDFFSIDEHTLRSYNYWTLWTTHQHKRNIQFDTDSTLPDTADHALINRQHNAGISFFKVTTGPQRARFQDAVVLKQKWQPANYLYQFSCQSVIELQDGWFLRDCSRFPE